MGVGIAALRAWHLPTTRASVAAAGLVAGILTPLAALPGPPVALTYRPDDVRVMRSTMSAFFGIVSLGSLAVLLWGEASWSSVTTGLMLTPAVVAGALISIPVARRLSPSTVRHAASWLSLLAGVTLILRTVLA